MANMSSIHSHVARNSARLRCEGSIGRKKIAPRPAFLRRLAIERSLDQEVFRALRGESDQIEDNLLEDDFLDDEDNGDNFREECDECGYYVCRCAEFQEECYQCGYAKCQCSDPDVWYDDLYDWGWHDDCDGPVYRTPTHHSGERIDIFSGRTGMGLLKSISGTRLIEPDTLELLEQNGVDPEDLKLSDYLWAVHECEERRINRLNYNLPARFAYDLCPTDAEWLDCFAETVSTSSEDDYWDEQWRQWEEEQNFVYVDPKGRHKRLVSFTELNNGKVRRRKRQRFCRSFFFCIDYGIDYLKKIRARAAFDAMLIKHGIEEARSPVEFTPIIYVPKPRPTAEVHIIVKRGRRQMIKPAGNIITHYTQRGRIRTREFVKA